jgi:hypothetical protein
MKYARVGLVATITIMIAASSAAVAQDRERDPGSFNRSQNESWEGDSGRAYDERGAETRRGRHGSDAEQSRDIENGQAGDDQFVRFRFTRGHAQFDIRCPANDLMRDCLQAGSQFIKQVSQGPVSMETRAGEVPSPGSAPSTKQQ